jgi:prophage regulatory protein
VEFWRKPVVVARTGLSYPTIWRMMKRGEFPQSRALSGRAVGWLASEVIEWIRSRP